MDGLPADLYKLCRSILLQCDQFQSNESLKAVFVTGGLALYYSRIPETNSVEDRVDQCLAFLLKQRWGGEPVLALFLEALQSRYQEGDDLHTALRDLAPDIRVALTQTPTLSAHLASTPYTAVPTTSVSENASSRAQALFNRILEIDFKAQIELVEDTLQEHRIAAFLVHGDPMYGPNCGQAILVERLFYLWSDEDEGHRISINIGSPGVWAGIPALWGHIARYFGLSNSTAPDEIVEKSIKDGRRKIWYLFFTK